MDNGWQVYYYISSSGDNPVKDLLDEYPAAKAKAFRIFQYIKEYGLTAKIPAKEIKTALSRIPRVDK